MAAGAVADLAASVLQSRGGSLPPERQPAFADCVRDALVGSGTNTSTLALQALQGFIDGNG